jgi:hypothetical protein
MKITIIKNKMFILTSRIKTDFFSRIIAFNLFNHSYYVKSERAARTKFNIGIL